MSKLDEIIKEWDKHKITIEFGGDAPMEWGIPEWLCDQLIEALKEEIGKEYEQGFIRTAIDLAYSKLKEAVKER
jgi:hypothetical protein